MHALKPEDVSKQRDRCVEVPGQGAEKADLLDVHAHFIPQRSDQPSSGSIPVLRACHNRSVAEGGPAENVPSAPVGRGPGYVRSLANSGVRRIRWLDPRGRRRHDHGLEDGVSTIRARIKKPADA